jgi:glycosyltransferase involved in cell wall biosynthesis
MAIWPKWREKLDSPSLEGGLRLKNILKVGAVNQPLISYVTVVRNSAKTLERTIKSVQAQTYGNVEHLILDGNSTDGTIELIMKYEESIDYFASEPDKGLYDALNKIIPLCRGDLILVLNSDDWLSDRSGEYAVDQYIRNNSQVICGTAKVLINGHQSMLWTPQKVTDNSFLSVANLNHNAVYATRKAYELSGPYDSSYMIAADTKWILTCFDNGADFSYTDKVLVNYSLGGVSSDIYWHMEECKRIIKEKFRFLTGDEVVALHYIYYQWREGFKYPLAPFNPLEEVEKILKKYPENEQLKSAIDFEHKFVTAVKNQESTVNVVTTRWCKEKVKYVLFKFPFVYRLAKKIIKFFS